MNGDTAPWIKASASDGTGNCVEVQRLANGSRRVRDSKAGDEGPVLSFTPGEWAAFLDGARQGEFD